MKKHEQLKDGKIKEEGTLDKEFTVPLMFHIANRIKCLEEATNGVVALQFSNHPHGGLGMVIRIYLPQSGKEYSYPDIISNQELLTRNMETLRVDVLFDAIHEALEKVQPVTSISGGLLHH